MLSTGQVYTTHSTFEIGKQIKVSAYLFDSVDQNNVPIPGVIKIWCSAACEMPGDTKKF